MPEHGITQCFLVDHIQRVTEHMQTVGYRRQYLLVATATWHIGVDPFLDMFNIGAHSHCNGLQQVIIKNNHAFTGRHTFFAIGRLSLQTVSGFYFDNPMRSGVT